MEEFTFIKRIQATKLRFSASVEMRAVGLRVVQRGNVPVRKEAGKMGKGFSTLKLFKECDNGYVRAGSRASAVQSRMFCAS